MLEDFWELYSIIITHLSAISYDYSLYNVVPMVVYNLFVCFCWLLLLSIYLPTESIHFVCGKMEMKNYKNKITDIWDACCVVAWNIECSLLYNFYFCLLYFFLFCCYCCCAENININENLILLLIGNEWEKNRRFLFLSFSFHTSAVSILFLFFFWYMRSIK